MHEGILNGCSLRTQLEISKSLVSQASATSTKLTRATRSIENRSRDTVRVLPVLSSKEKLNNSSCHDEYTAHDSGDTHGNDIANSIKQTGIDRHSVDVEAGTNCGDVPHEEHFAGKINNMKAITRRSMRDSQKTQETAHNGTLQESVQEGDTNYLDLVSSLAEPAVVFSPTQVHTQTILFPESQRFAKTPATIGRKRDAAGNAIDTPVVHRNPFAVAGKTPQSPGGLSQLFENTQAASSPFPNVLPLELRSDLPSPGVALQRRVQHALSSSPMQPISAYQKPGTEPAAKYVRSSESQHRRSSSRDRHDNEDPSQESLDLGWDGDQSLTGAQSRRQKELKAQGQFKAASMPVSPPKNDIAVARQRSGSEDPISTMVRSQSPPSSPPRFSARIIPEDEECDMDPTQTQYIESNPSGEAPAIVGEDVDIDTDPVTIPETSIRPYHLQTQTLPPTQPSPSIRQTRTRKSNDTINLLGDGQIRVVNSQRSRPGTQEQARGLPKISSLESVEIIPASPEYDNPRNGYHDENSMSKPTETTQQAERVAGRVEGRGQLETMAPPRDLDVSRVLETSSIRNNQASHDRNRLSSAPEIQPPTSSKDTNHSSQPIHVPERRSKRKRMEDISQEDDVLPATQISSFDVLEGLALDEDPEAAQALASSPQQTASIRKRARLDYEVWEERIPVIPEDRTANESKSKPILQEAFHVTENASVPNIVARANPTAQSSPSGETDNEVDTEDDQRVQENDAMVFKNSTPERRPVRASKWDLGESPKARFTIDRPKARLQPAPESLRQVAAKRSRQKKSAAIVTVDSVPGPIQETMSDTLSANTATTVQTTPSEAISEVLSPDMVLAHFYDGKTKYYPARYFKAVNDQLLIRWPGYDAEYVPAHSVCSYDLRIGDEVRVELDVFPKANFIVGSLLTKEQQENHAESITDVYGHTHLTLKAKAGKTYPKGYNAQTPIAIGSISIDMNQWRRTNKRPKVYADDIPAPAGTDSAYSTPPPRTTEPVTPSSRNRNAVKKEFVLTPTRRVGLFSNMAFALSFDEDMRAKYAKLIYDNGGVILESGFQELFDDRCDLKPDFCKFGFTASLSNSHAAKAKHLHALALGLPCLSGKWVEASLAGANLQPWEDYLLPAGESLELDRAVKSRILRLPDFDQFNLAEVLEKRKFHFNGPLVLFTKRRSDRERQYLTLAQAISSVHVEEVGDLKAVMARIANSENHGTIWLLVEKGGAKAAEELVQDLMCAPEKKKRRSKGRDSDSNLRKLDIRVIDSETVKQTLIMGRLSVHNQE